MVNLLGYTFADTLKSMIIRIISFLFIITSFLQATDQITIMINPAGDAQQTGRKIDGYFERGITLQFFEALKEELKKQCPDQPIRIISTRCPGETIQELQNANFANRLKVDFYLSINFYQETKTKPDLFLYYFSYHDNFIMKQSDLSVYPYDKAYLVNSTKTKNYAASMEKALRTVQYNNKFSVRGVFGLPFAPLIGIVAPAIGIEIGLKNKDDWKSYVEPVAHSLTCLITLQR